MCLPRKATPINIEGKLFLGAELGLSSMEVSPNKDTAGKGMPFYHRHNRNEELYIFLGGQGEMSIDDEIVPVQEGAVVSVQPEARRAWWNTGDADLTYVMIQAPVGGLQAAGVEDGEIVEGAVPWSWDLRGGNRGSVTTAPQLRHLAIPAQVGQMRAARCIGRVKSRNLCAERAIADIVEAIRRLM